MQTLYIDYSGGKFESWFYSDYQRWRFMESYDINDIIREAKRQKFTKIVKTDTAKMFEKQLMSNPMPTYYRIKEEYREPKEADILYYIAEDNGDRVLISPVEWDYDIVPKELVRRYMIEPVEENPDNPEYLGVARSIKKKYKVDKQGIIRDSGKFEGEFYWAPYWYEFYIDGEGERLLSGDQLIYITREDNDVWEDELDPDTVAMLVGEDDNGFFYVRELTESEVEEIRDEEPDSEYQMFYDVMGYLERTGFRNSYEIELDDDAILLYHTSNAMSYYIDEAARGHVRGINERFKTDIAELETRGDVTTIVINVDVPPDEII